MRHILALWAFLLALAGPALGQTIMVTAGEHAGFTRVVLNARSALTWTLDGEGRTRRLSIGGAAGRLDLSQLFARIPRTRLSDAQIRDDALFLTMVCDCRVTAWQDRPGLVVIDIADPPALQAIAPDQRAEPPDTLTAARLAGEAVARARPLPQSGQTSEAFDLRAREALSGQLGLGVAQAVGQGLLDPAVTPARETQVVLPGSSEAATSDNIRIVSALAQPELPLAPSTEDRTRCQGAEVLDALLDRSGTDFSSSFAQLSQGLYGEFDQTSPTILQDLVLLYLASGFGAEARALIDNAAQPLPGRDFLLGLADVLEGRMSNSRLRVAEAISCGGLASLAAALAGASPEDTNESPDTIALVFTRLPPPLRSIVGADLVRFLVRAEALDAARIVAERLRSSPFSESVEVDRVSAMLALARGHIPEAVAHLDPVSSSALEAMTERLDLALSTETAVPEETLSDAETLAATSRSTPSGIEVMIQITRLRARGSTPASAFPVLDRLQSWLPTTEGNTRTISDLRNEVWLALARQPDDRHLLESILARDDWRDADLAPETRLGLAQRLVNFGFAQPAETLLSGLDGPESRLILGRAALVRGEAEAALDLIDGAPGTDAIRLRAAALTRLGRHAEAATEFSRLGQLDDAVRAAIQAADWREVERLQRQSTQPEGAPLETMLGRLPGHAEVLRLQRNQSDMAATTAPAIETASDDLQPPPETEAQQVSTDPARLPANDTLDSAALVEETAEPPLPRVADAAELFDRLGMIRRGTTLIAESERLRQAISDLVSGPP